MQQQKYHKINFGQKFVRKLNKLKFMIFFSVIENFLWQSDKVIGSLGLFLCKNNDVMSTNAAS